MIYSTQRGIVQETNLEEKIQGDNLDRLPEGSTKDTNSASGRSTSFTRNEKGDWYRDMSSPGGTQYSQHGNKRGSSNGRKPEGNYRVNSLAVEEPVPTNDEYRTVFTNSNMYPNCPDYNFQTEPSYVSTIKIYNTNMGLFESLFSSFYNSTNHVHNNFDSYEMGEKTFICRKLKRFIFPQQDILDPK